MKNWSKKRKILLGIFLILVIAQAIRPQKNNGNPTSTKDITKVVSVPDSVLAVLKKSCYDCHSNYTVYPWYDEITPVNWWVAHHINEGKRALNFTEFGGYRPRRKAQEFEYIAKSITHGSMPLNSYLWMHGDSKLSETQKQLIVDWANVSEKTIQP